MSRVVLIGVLLFLQVASARAQWVRQDVISWRPAGTTADSYGDGVYVEDYVAALGSSSYVVDTMHDPGTTDADRIQKLAVQTWSWQGEDGFPDAGERRVDQVGSISGSAYGSYASAIAASGITEGNFVHNHSVSADGDYGPYSGPPSGTHMPDKAHTWKDSLPSGLVALSIGVEMYAETSATLLSLGSATAISRAEVTMGDPYVVL